MRVVRPLCKLMDMNMIEEDDDNFNFKFLGRSQKEIDEYHKSISFDIFFKSQKEIQKEKIDELLKKAVSSLQPKEIFEIINSGIELEKFIPMALELIEKRKPIYLENICENEYIILDKQSAYFFKNSHQKKRYEKLKLWKKNRGNCISPKTGKIRKSYWTKELAAMAAKLQPSSYGEQSPFQCDSCGEWHLTPTSHHTPSKTCEYCTDENGGSKQLYLTNEAAKKRAKIISLERGVILNVYECPYNKGWHLTKKPV